MTHLFFRASLTGLVLLAPFALPAGETGGTDDAELGTLLARISLEHPRVTSRLHALRASRAAEAYADRTYPDPQVSIGRTRGSMTKSMVFPDVGYEEAAARGMEYRVEQPIPFPGKLSAEARIAEVASRRSRVMVRIERNDVAGEFLATLIEARRLSRALELTRGFAARSRILASAARVRYEGGMGTLAEVATAQVKERDYVSRATAIAGDYQARLRELEYYLAPGAQSVPDDTRAAEMAASIVGAGAGRLDRFLAGLGETLSARRARLAEVSPALALARLDVEEFERMHDRAVFEYLPDFSIFAGYRRDNASSRFYEINNTRETMYTFGVTMRVPLWSAISNHKQLEEHSEHALSDQSRALDVRRRLESLFDQAAAERDALERRLVQYRSEILPKARTARESSVIAYEAGRLPFATVLLAYEDLYRFELEALMLEADAQRRVLIQAATVDALLPAGDFESGSGPESKPGASHAHGG